MKYFVILELKHHPLFDSIDWEQVASRTNDPPFAPNRIEINQNVPLIDLTKTLEIDIDDETEAIFDERFRSRLHKSLDKLLLSSVFLSRF